VIAVAVLSQPHDGFQYGLLHGDELVLLFREALTVFPLRLFVAAPVFRRPP
jgi:hypothetical protein